MKFSFSDGFLNLFLPIGLKIIQQQQKEKQPTDNTSRLVIYPWAVVGIFCRLFGEMIPLHTALL